MNALSEEILVKIFSHLNQRDLCSGIAPVCKQWCRLSRDQTLWTSLHIYRYNEFTSHFLEFTPRLSAFTISNFIDRSSPASPDPLAVAATKCPRIRSITLRNWVTHRPSEITNLQLIKSFPRLKNLDLNNSNLNYINFAPVLGELQCLRELNLNRCSGVSVTAIASLCQLLRSGKLRMLERIDLRFRYRRADLVLHALSTHAAERLKSVAISLVSHSSYLYLRTFKNLTELTLSSSSEFRDDSLLAVAYLPKLKVLRVSGVWGVGRDGFLRFFLMAKCQETLTDLELTQCGYISPAGVSLLAFRFGNLRHLSLDSCSEVNDKAVGAVVRKCAHLEELRLCNLPLVTALFKCPNHPPLPTFASNLKVVQVRHGVETHWHCTFQSN